MASTSSPLMPPQADSNQPLLPCIQFLKAHFQHGGIDKAGYDLFYRMIEMMSAIGWEASTIFFSDTLPATSKFNIERYAECIGDGLVVFHENVSKAGRKAVEAHKSLPRLEDDDEQVMETKLKQWRWKLKMLHEPTGNDGRLFRLVIQHFDSIALDRLIQLNICKPHYALAQIVDRAREIHEAIWRLACLACKADKLVLGMDERLKRAEQHLQAAKSEAKSATVLQSLPSPELLEATVYQPPTDQKVTVARPMLSKSFGVAEEELVRRSHARAATYSGSTYTTAAADSRSLQPSPRHSPLAVSKGRRGPSLPRIFTGSFSQLENSLRLLEIDKVQTPVTPNIADEVPVKVRDFGATPATSPGALPSPIALQRREALVDRDVEFQDRIINGEIVKNRRPSNKSRAQTVDDSAGGVEAWLTEGPSYHSS